MKIEVKRLRRIDPYIEEKTSTGFYNQFQQDFYESVILSDRKIAVEAQWVYWDYMERVDDSLFKEIISECEDKKIKTLMGFKNNWNKVLIAQFMPRCTSDLMTEIEPCFGLLREISIGSLSTSLCGYLSLTSMMSTGQRYAIRILYLLMK